MDMLVIIVLAIVLYLIGILFLIFTNNRLTILATASMGVITHAYLLYRWIDVTQGQNLSIPNLFSLSTWLIASLILLTTLRRPVENLILLIFPLAIISILLILLFPQPAIINTAAQPELLIHILLAVLTLSILSIAGLQAILLGVQEHQLRHKQINLWIQKLPAVEIMEKTLFETIAIGFILLSILLITSIYYFHNELLAVFIEKTLIVASAWVIFAILLIGRLIFGWRSQKAIYYTLGGVLLLILAYFGNKLLIS